MLFFLQVLFSLEQWASEMERLEISEDEHLAEGALNKHTELMQHMKNTVDLVLQRGQDLQQARHNHVIPHNSNTACL